MTAVRKSSTANADTLGSKTARALRVVGGLAAMHTVALQGVPASTAQEVLAGLTTIKEPAFLRTLGMHPKTFSRYSKENKALDTNATDRLLRLVAVLELASTVFGSKARAEAWLAAPALGLEQQVPLDLLQTMPGTEMVKNLLNRLDHGVYA